MYRPDYFKVDDLQSCIDLIDSYPLGMLVTPTENSLQTSYLPFLIEQNGNDLTLIAHMAKANTQTANLDGHFALVSFRGPDRYISPSWYDSKPEVPTWNYSVVEARGRVEILDHGDDIESILQKSVKHFEKRNNTAWTYELPQKFRDSLIKHIIGIRIQVQTIEGKFKLSQNRKSQDRELVMKNLKQSSSDNDLAMLALMEKSKKTGPL